VPLAGQIASIGMSRAALVVASNRGPLSFSLDERGDPVPSGSSGGLAGALHLVVAGSDAAWVACVMSEADRKAAAAGLMAAEGVQLVTVEPDPDTYRMAYDVVSNATLWYLHHLLFDLSRRPRLDRHWHEAWSAYRTFNALFAQAIDEVAARGATVLVQDYHLSLVPGLLASRRPDLDVVHFTHTPFADPATLRVLPVAARTELLDGLAAARRCGFHTERWAAAFRACCADSGIAPPPTFVSPLAPDAPLLTQRAGAPTVAAARAQLDAVVGGRKLVLRVDRVDPAKNQLRGFWAFDELLEREPSLRGEVVLVALAYPSRQSLPDYQAYAAEIEHTAAVVNERWGDGQWQPVILDVADDPDRSFAALTRYDVLLVNPIRDGLNLVAKEGPLVNQVDGVVALSQEAGSFEELRSAVVALNPYDVSGTAEALAHALAMDGAERARRAAELRRLVTARTPRDWLSDQLDLRG